MSSRGRQASARPEVEWDFSSLVTSASKVLLTTALLCALLSTCGSVVVVVRKYHAETVGFDRARTGEEGGGGQDAEAEGPVSTSRICHVSPLCGST